MSRTGALALLLALAGAGACRPVRPRLDRPNGVAAAPDGTLYVMDFGNGRVVHLSPSGRVLGSLGGSGRERSGISSGRDVTLDSKGNIYVADQLRADGALIRDGVMAFSKEGRFLFERGREDYGQPGGKARRVYGVAVDAKDRLFTADFGTETVRVFDASGRSLAVLFGRSGRGPGEFNGLNDVAVDTGRGLLYAADSRNCRIQQFTLVEGADGRLNAVFRKAFGSYGRGRGQLWYPSSVAVDAGTGHLFVGDVGNRRIAELDPEGAPVASLSPEGVRDWEVMGLSVGPNGTVWAADALNGVVWGFSRDGRVKARLAPD